MTESAMAESALPFPGRPVRQTASSFILAALRGAILDMSLPPGTALNEKELTERFDVSRTPVREAIIRLAEERLVDIFPQSGTFVGRIPLAALPEAVIIRKALEQAALDLAIDHADEKALAGLDALIKRQSFFARRRDQTGFHAADEEFHEKIAAAAGHPGIWRGAQAAKTQIDRCRRLTLPHPGRMEQVVKEHRAILVALRGRKRRQARAALDVHLSAVLPDAEAIRRQYPTYFV